MQKKTYPTKKQEFDPKTYAKKQESDKKWRTKHDYTTVMISRKTKEKLKKLKGEKSIRQFLDDHFAIQK